jgi:hypothetical protein
VTHFCRFYPSMGIAFNEVCEAGVDMLATRDDSTPYRLPCYDPSIAHRCAKHAPYTAAEIAERDAALNAFMLKLDAAVGWTLVGETCAHCGATVDRMEQVGKCVYARPCGCRQYQGTLPDAGKDGS